MKEKQQQNIEKFIEIVKDVRICMMITIEKNAEYLSSRPMAVSSISEDGAMWFFTKASSHKVEEINSRKSVAIAIADERSSNYLMINGTANLLNDKEKMKELWASKLTEWFPLGLEDPDMILIRVIPLEINYWDSISSKMILLFNILKAKGPGQLYSAGENVAITL